MPEPDVDPEAPRPERAPSRESLQRMTEIEAELATRWPESMIEPSLDRIGRLVHLLGDPQESYPVLHLTGTNGKSSTARMCESLLRASGLRTGLVTSPHLHSVRERIVLDGRPVSVERFTAAYDEIAPYLAIVDAESAETGGPPMSFFEAITGLAFAVFADAPVDVAVVEVGMGGRWDATNVADGRVAVVTPIGLDHMEYLGPTVAAIAVEKAGIIKPGATAVLARQSLEAAEVLLAQCVDVGATVAREGVEFGVVDRAVAVGGQLVGLRTPTAEYPGLLLPLHGEHQARNAATALMAVEAFLAGGGELATDVVAEGFATVRSPGRVEVVRRSPTVVVDAAHNPHGAAVLAATLGEAFAFSHLVAVVAVLADKDARGILEALAPVVDEVVITRTGSPRAMPAADLADLAVEVFGDDRVHVQDALADALDTALGLADAADERTGGGAGVVVTGSVVTVADARTLLGAPTP